MTVRRGVLASALAAFSLCALTCGRSESAAPQAKPKLPRVLVTMSPTLGNAPLAIAKDAGFFEQEGIDAELVSTDTNSALLALLTGKMDVVAPPIRAGLFNMIARGAKIQIVADRSHSEAGGCAGEAFVAPPEMAERILATGDYRHQRFATTRGGMMEFLVQRLLEQHHLEEKDVEFVQLPQDNLSSGSLRKNVAAIRYLSEPSLNAVVAEGIARVVITPEEILSHYPHGVLVYGPRMLGDRDLGVRFMRAYLRAIQRFDEGPTATNVASIAGYMHLPAESIRHSCWPKFSPDGRIFVEPVQAFIDWGRQRGYVEADLPTSAWWNPSFAEAASKGLEGH